MRVERELMRGAGPVAVLKLLEQAEMYGYELVQALAERSGGILAMGQSTLYPLLYNLEAKGFVASRWVTPATGRRRKYYTLTDRGRRRLAEDTEQWCRLTSAMTALGIVGDATGAPRGTGVPA
ncbi:MAG: helix-turn-helix transcriptional regulator [Phycisphaerales bacterium]|nr:PadR family transcriptional regulator [Phycisphaerae bacterium]NNF43204.1 helix-turn-helix transcriptional regulator [Phycisphaerales bacterium]NNM26133.1 helix-turn-helix transcriptional regulator [Phycisphaerales bacterium]